MYFDAESVRSMLRAHDRTIESLGLWAEACTDESHPDHSRAIAFALELGPLMWVRAERLARLSSGCDLEAMAKRLAGEPKR